MTSRTDRAKQSANSAIRLRTLCCWSSVKSEPIATCLSISATRRGLFGCVVRVKSEWSPFISTSGCRSPGSSASVFVSWIVHIESHHSRSRGIRFCMLCFCLLRARRPGLRLVLLSALLVIVLTSDSSLVCLSMHSRLLVIDDRTCLEGELSSPCTVFAFSPAKFVLVHALIMVLHFPSSGILRVSSP